MGTINYLNKDGSQGSQQQKPPSQPMHDPIVHTPPIVHYVIGAFGILFGFAANCWQVYTTVLALLQIMTPPKETFNITKMGFKLAVAILIALAAQFGLTILVWRIDTKWKVKNATSGSSSSAGNMLKGYGLAAVEVVQQTDLVTAWGLISFVVDTVGDFTFISSTLTGIPLAQTIAVTFLYAASLYALSTIGFVRSVEYIWAGLITSANYVKSVQSQQQNKP